MQGSTGDSYKISQKVAKPLSNLLNKDVAFVFNEECMEAFNDLKTRLVSALVITAPDWGQEF